VSKHNRTFQNSTVISSVVLHFVPDIYICQTASLTCSAKYTLVIIAMNIKITTFYSILIFFAFQNTDTRHVVCVSQPQTAPAAGRLCSSNANINVFVWL